MKCKGLSYSSLKLIAMVLMLMDHMWATLIPGNMWMTWVGRMAFPIFAYQVAQGAIHTGDRRKYARRLLIFALISEIPFNLMYMSSPIFPFHQNVIFTLLFGFMAIIAVQKWEEKQSRKQLVFSILQAGFWILLGMLLLVDYSWQGVCTVLGFYLLEKIENQPLRGIMQVALLILLNQVFFNGNYIPLSLLGWEFEFHTQCYAVGALVFIWFYNGKKGISKKWFQYLGYLFYPLHMLGLYLLSVIL